MKIKLIFYAISVVLISITSFSSAKNDQQPLKRPSIDETAQDSDGKFFDQIALDSFSRPSKTEFPDDFPNYPHTFYTASEEFRKSLKKPQKSTEKITYITPEPSVRESFSQDYVHHALKTQSEKSGVKEKIHPTQVSAASEEHFNIHTRDDTKKALKRKKVNNSENFDEYKNIFHESKRLYSKSTTTTSTFAPFLDDSEKFYRPQSSGAVIKKETSKQKQGDEIVENYHYYYPEKSSIEEQFPSSTSTPTFAPKYSESWQTKKPKIKNPQKKKVVHEFTSTDPYQFQPVLPRPSEYATFEHFYPQLDLPSSTIVPSSSSAPTKILKPTKKFNNFYLPTSTMSPSTTMTPKKPRKPSTTQAPFKSYKSYSTPSTVAHFSTTKAPDYFKYSTPTTSAPMKIHESFYIHPSTSSSPSIIDTNVEETRENVVVIKPKSNFINMESSSEPIDETKERIIYRFVPEFHTINQTNDNQNYFYQNFNESSSLNEDEFIQNFHKNYNYEHFTEKDAGPLPMNDDYKFDQDTQRADKKAMIVQISNDDENENYHRQHHQLDLNEREAPPPYRGDYQDEQDHEAEASKNQYLFLYSLDDEEKKQRSKSQKMKKGKSQEPDYFYHHHQHHYQNPKNLDEGDYDPEIDSEFDSDLLNSDNVRIVDPNVRGGRPLEFTKDDYLRHIKQAVVQYMKEHGQDTNSPSFKQKSQGPTKAALKQSAQNLQQFKQLQSSMKLPKNVYTSSQLKEAIEDLRESPQVDFTTKRPKAKPIDLTALDVGQSYQHVSHFDHSAVLKNVEGFDQTNAMTKSKNPFSLQNYQDINNLKKPQFNEESDDQQSKQQNLFKGYKLPQIKPFGQDQSSFSQMSYDGNKLPRLRGQDDDDDEDNEVKDPVDAPIQIINGIPVANPYNIDLNTLKYMLGGIAQAEVNDQVKDLDSSSSNQQQFKFPNNWKIPMNQLQSQFGSSPTSMYPVFGQQNSQHDNRRQKKNNNNNNNNNNNQENMKFPLLSQLQNYNNKNHKKQQKNHRNQGITDYSSWNTNKKHRSEPQVAASNHNKIYLRPVMRSKSRDEKLLPKLPVPRIRQLTPSTEMRPPPVVKPPKAHVVVKKLV